MGDYSQRPFALEKGVTYKVNFNGIDYSCVGHIVDGRVCIGNDSVFGLAQNTREPFFIKDQDNFSEWYVFLESGDACNITVSYSAIKQLDPIYLPTAAVISNATGETPTAAEFNALLQALKDAGLMATE